MSDLLPPVSPDPSAYPTPLVLYDGLCRLCAGTVVFVIKRDRHKRVWFASLQSAFGRRLLEKVGLPTDAVKTFVLIEAGGHSTRSTAALRTARYLDGPWPWLYAFILVPRPIRDAVYEWVARNRYRWFGREQACFRPEPTIQDRFIDDQHESGQSRGRPAPDAESSEGPRPRIDR